jgi:hypothetical protein
MMSGTLQRPMRWPWQPDPPKRSNNQIDHLLAAATYQVGVSDAECPVLGEE